MTKTVAASLLVALKSVPPDSITGPGFICDGGSITLKVSGGQLGLGAEWVWYNQSDLEIERGESISVNASVGSIVKVRALSQCFETEFVSKPIVVNSSSRIETIIKTDNPDGRTTLTVKGKLGTGATWVWYSAKKTKKKMHYERFGAGPFITVSDAKDMHYKVVTEGGFCDSIQEVFKEIDNGLTPSANREWSKRYCLSNYTNFTHIGFIAGVMSFTDSLPVQMSGQNAGTKSKTEASIQAQGFNWGVMYHPYMYERPKSLGFKPFSFSIGFYYSGEYGVLPLQFTTLAVDTLGGVYNTYERSRFKSSFGSELAIGVRRLRFYFDVQQTQNKYYLGVSYVKASESTDVAYHYEGNSTTMKIGLRLGKYVAKTAEKGVLGANADVYYFMTQIGNSNYSMNNTQVALPNQGIGLSIWVQSILRFNCYACWDSDSRRNLGVSLAYNLDLFY